MTGSGRLEGSVALVTGAAGGLGSAVVRRFADEGARVVAADLAHDAPQDGPGGVLPVALDVTDERAWSEVVAEVERRFGRLDVVVLAAGIVVAGPLLTTSVADFDRVLAVNVTGTFLGIRECAPLLARGGGGSVLTFSSVNGLLPAPGLNAYTASKYAVRGLTRTAAIELAPDGIRVNAICPGSIDTAITDTTDFGGVDYAAYAASVPLGRRGLPGDVAEVALFLAESASGYLTGAEIVVDGGLIAGRRIPSTADRTREATMSTPIADT